MAEQKQMHRPVTAVVKGSGFSSAGGGFTRIEINGKRHHPDDVATAVSCHRFLLAALEAGAGAIAREASEVEHVTRWDNRTVLELRLIEGRLRAAIAKAEGRATGAEG